MSVQFDQDNNFITTLYNIRGNVLRMLSQRGYTDYIKKYHADVTMDDFKKAYKQNNITIYLYKTKKNIEGKDIKTQCIVYFVDPTSRVGKVKQQFMKLMSTLEPTYDKEVDIVDLIMIAEDRDKNIFMHSISKYVKGYQQSYNDRKSYKHMIITELFYYSEVSFDLMEHYLVPKHELVAKEKETEILKTFGCTKDQLPRISKNDDIVARYFGANIGDIFRIYRKSPTAGISVYYRVVVP